MKDMTQASLGVVSAYSHQPNTTLIDLDWPMYGEVTIKCNGKKFSLAEVRHALALVSEMKEKL